MIITYLFIIYNYFNTYIYSVLNFKHGVFIVTLFWGFIRIFG